jgi:hypothetical protein
MALNFPSAPSANATYTFSGKTWTYNGNAWNVTSATLSTSVVPEGSNLYFSNARATAAVINSSLSNVTVTGNVIAGNVIISTSGGVQFSDGSTQTTAAGASVIGFTNSTVTSFPGSSVNTDYGDLITSSTDAFNVALSTAYDCMEPRGSITTADLAVL